MQCPGERNVKQYYSCMSAMNDIFLNCKNMLRRQDILPVVEFDWEKQYQGDRKWKRRVKKDRITYHGMSILWVWQNCQP